MTEKSMKNKTIHRTFLRHLILTLLLAFFPFYISLRSDVISNEAFYMWFQIHGFFILFLFIGLLFTGVLSYQVASSGKIAAYFYEKTESTNITKIRKHIFLIATAVHRCARCLGFWTGGLLAFIFAIIYWKSSLLWLYFFFTGASISATISTGLDLYNAIRSIREEPAD